MVIRRDATALQDLTVRPNDSHGGVDHLELAGEVQELNIAVGSGNN